MVVLIVQKNVSVSPAQKMLRRYLKGMLTPLLLEQRVIASKSFKREGVSQMFDSGDFDTSVDMHIDGTVTKDGQSYSMYVHFSDSFQYGVSTDYSASTGTMYDAQSSSMNDYSSEDDYVVGESYSLQTPDELKVLALKEFEDDEKDDMGAPKGSIAKMLSDEEKEIHNILKDVVPERETCVLHSTLS